jgi:hypothetical protein
MIKRILLVVLLTIASAAVATAQTAALKNYYNQENKVGFKYPASWTTGKTKWDVGTKTVQIEGDPGFTVLMDLSNPELKPASAVSQAEVALSVAAIDQATCQAMKDPATETKAVARKVGTLAFSYVETEDSGMGRSGTTDHYRTFQDGRCYELAFLKYGEITRKRPDRGERTLDQQFNAILRSLYFGK